MIGCAKKKDKKRETFVVAEGETYKSKAGLQFTITFGGGKSGQNGAGETISSGAYQIKVDSQVIDYRHSTDDPPWYVEGRASGFVWSIDQRPGGDKYRVALVPERDLINSDGQPKHDARQLSDSEAERMGCGAFSSAFTGAHVLVLRYGKGCEIAITRLTGRTLVRKQRAGK